MTRSHTATIALIAMMLVLSGCCGAVAELEQANIQSTQLKQQKVASSLEQYNLLNKGYPDSLDALTNPAKGVAFSKPDDIIDAWGTTFVYQKTEDGSFELISKGPDKAEGTEDDISYQRGS